MNKIYLNNPKSDDVKLKAMMESLIQRAKAVPPGMCPLEAQYTYLQVCISQTCGKCVPCRDGLPQLARLLKSVLDDEAGSTAAEEIRALAEIIKDSADCAIGYQAADMVLQGLDKFKSEYESHIENKTCTCEKGQKVPCVHYCPAHVDIPGYIALINQRDYAGAINLIRKDNPLPTACGFICEHPCEEPCRRQLIDDAINIRGLKKYAVDQIAADKVAVPKALPSTGKSIGVIGGGPAGLTAAYYLALMGHKVVIYERHDKLGGMLRYGIPEYRFPRHRLDEDINAILSAGDIEVKYNTNINSAEAVKEVREAHDALFVSIGAQNGKKPRFENANAGNVVSAVDMLYGVSIGYKPDYTGKNVVVIGGGNVAVDAARTAIRCNPDSVHMVYRRRQVDMTALFEEVNSAVTEGVDIMPLASPIKVEKDASGFCKALVVKPQIVGEYDAAGRPTPRDAMKDPVTIPCDVIIVAIGQDIETAPFEEFGLTTEKGAFKAGLDTATDIPGVFVGGDCQSGPATAIKAVAAGKVAARNIDDYLGYYHKLNCEVTAPAPRANLRVQVGRVNLYERPSYIRKKDFELTENPMTFEEAMQESCRCLRCDHFGCGAMEGGCDR